MLIQHFCQGLLRCLLSHLNNFCETTNFVQIILIQHCSRFIEDFKISLKQLLWSHCTNSHQNLCGHTLNGYLPSLFKFCWFISFFKVYWSVLYFIYTTSVKTLYLQTTPDFVCPYLEKVPTNFVQIMLIQPVFQVLLKFFNISFTGKWLLWSRCTNSIQILCGHTLSRYLKNLFKLYLFKKFSSFLKDFNISSRRRLKLLLQFTPNFIWTYLDCVPTKFVQILQTLHLFQVLLFLIFFVNDFFTEGTTSVQGCFSKKCDGASSVHGIYTGKYMVDRDIEEIAMTWRGDQKRIWYILELGHQVQKKLNFYLSNLWSIYNF